ncbi:hypothetical protein [Pseudodesulfovibrio hydrargyri]|nr:hypothetical protein [Pseudodesulfovibrio hydrargyri]
MKILLIAISFLCLLAAPVHAAPHDLSEWNQKECIEMVFIGGESIKDEKGQKIMGAELIAAGLNQAIPMVVSAIQKKIKESDLKYTATYGATVAGSNLLLVKDGEENKQLAEIQLTRYAAHKKTPSGHHRKKASVITLLVHEEKNGAFTFTVKEAEVHYAKCRIDHRENVREKPNFPYIDLKIDITIQCFWLDWEGNPRSAILGALALPAPGVPVRGDSLEEPAPKPNHIDGHCPANALFGDSKKPKYVSWFPPFPVNYYKDRQTNDVAYVLNITVTEFDDYTALVKKYGEFASGMADILQGMALNLVQQITAPEK